jgi:hypothetical protein
MEVAAILTSDEKILAPLREFLINHKGLVFEAEDEDTAYFTNKKKKKNEIFFHFKNDIEF